MSDRTKERMNERTNERENERANERGDEPVLRGRDGSTDGQGAGLPERWVWSTIGEVAKTTSGGTPSRERLEYFGGSIPWVKSGELKDGRITAVEEFITQEALDNSSAKLFPEGTPLVALYGANIGQTGILGLKAATNQAICAIFPQVSAFTPKFMIYLLRYQRPKLIECGAGGAQPNISQQIIRAFRFPLAPLPEQRRIVEAIETQFTRLDAAVAALERAQAALARYRAAVLQAAVEGRLVPTEAALAHEEGRDYETADALLERILEERRARWEEERWEYEVERAKKKAAQAERKAAGLPYYIRDLPEASWIDRTEEEYAPYLPKSDRWKRKYDEPEPPDTEGLPTLPEGWVWVSVDQLAFRIQYGYTESATDDPIGPKFLRITDIQDGKVDWNTVPYCSCPTSECDKYRLETGDIVFARTGATTGKSYLIKDHPQNAIFASYLIRLQFDQSLDPRFLDIFFGSPVYWPQIMTVRKGSAQPGVNATILATLHIPLPPLAEQRRIVEEVERRLSVVDELEEAISANLTRAARLRQAILKRAFEGRLVPQDPDDEPASALLARIQAGQT